MTKDTNSVETPISNYECFYKEELNFSEELYHVAHCLEKESKKEVMDYEEINDLLRTILSYSYRMQDLERDRYL